MIYSLYEKYQPTVSARKINEIHNDFARITSTQKSSKEELISLLKTMLTMLDIFVAIFLEKTTKKNSKNSSMPSSQTDKDDSSTTTKGTNGKGKLENNEIASNTRSTETIIKSKVSVCDVCGADLRKTPCEHIERRTTIDIIFEKVITHVDAEIKTCTDCGATVKGAFPASMPGPLQYGNGLKAYIINLLICQMVPLNRIQNMVKAMTGVVISPATILKFVLRLNQSLEAWELRSTKLLLKYPSIHVDETSLRVDKKNHWIHVYAAGDITLKFLHRKRGKEAIEDINIIPSYSGVMIHDCWSSYLSYGNCEHGLCGSHLTRELTAAIESNNYRWATNMKALLLETCKKVSRRKKKKLSHREYANLQKRYRNILTRGGRELPVIPPKPNGKRGVMAKSAAHNLWERLNEYEGSVLLFARKSEVSFTNNRAERDLRMSKVKQKVSGCFRTEVHAKAYCRISSYLQTMATKGNNPLIAIEKALTGDLE